MKLFIFLITISAVFITSCSNDPCETLTCVHGECIDGSCQCEDGYVGVNCNELPCVNGTSINGQCNCEPGSYGKLCDVSIRPGVYYITHLYYPKCSFVPNFDISANVTDHMVCGKDDSNETYCFLNFITLESDGKFVWSRGTNLISASGNTQNIFFDFQLGTYKVNKEFLTTTSDKGIIREAIIEKDKIKWIRNLTDGGNDCVWTEEYTIEN